ncbi:hypothetical protein [Helicobacter brantae]|uniref:Outer membrane beta-barrel protein n=1 Tax=Helicobacter brantae TaxID=375927 RepID=A0A3D8J0A8_9HELI|nr:hypothetical protein [Helicobacter brantae]RDU70928.1 hypothetical protein CQA58_03890 [Helicobacter brantae]
MKKLIFALFVLASLLEAKFFIGIESGGSYSQYVENQDSLNKSNQGRRGSVYGVYIGANLGTEHYFARDSMLFRWFVGAGGDVRVGYGDLNLGIDFMGTLYKNETSAFGLFLGIEMSTTLIGESSDFGGHVRAGMSTMLGSHHRFELYYRMLLGGFQEEQYYQIGNEPYGSTTFTYYRHYQRSDAVILAYKYVF